MQKLVFSFLLFILVSCNNSPDQKQYTQHQLDSIVAVEKAKEVARFQAIEDSIANKEKLEQEILDLKSQKEGIENRLALELANLEVEKDRLKTIKEYQFLRTQAEKEEQIKTQSYLIQNIEKTIKNCNLRLEKLESQLRTIDPNYIEEETLVQEPPTVQF